MITFFLFFFSFSALVTGFILSIKIGLGMLGGTILGGYLGDRFKSITHIWGQMQEIALGMLIGLLGGGLLGFLV